MKPARMDINEESNFEGEVIPLGLSAEDMPEVLMLLTDLYSKPKLACIREYSTNARDAHIEAGNDAPIEVFSPNSLAPNLVIRDRGVGMNLDSIRYVFTQYGRSTKREDDRLTGTLGMGCKSALAYCGQFAVKSVQDGKMILAQVSRKEDRTAALEVLEYLDTDEPNGVEITIPRMELGDFNRDELNDFFQYWREGEVLIDGKPPEFIQGRRLGDQIILQELPYNAYKEQVDVVVMGNVPYRLAPQHRLFDKKLLRSGSSVYNRTMTVVCYVKMGSVVPTPSREDVQYTIQTVKTLTKLGLEVTGRVKWMVEHDIASAPDHFEAAKVHHKWAHEMGVIVKDLKYRGEEIPNEFPVEGLHSFYLNRSRSHSTPPRATYGAVHRPLKLPGWLEYQAKDDAEPMIIVGVPFEKRPDRYKKETFRLELRAPTKAQIRTWAIVRGVEKALIMNQVHPDAQWLSGLTVIHWDEVKNLRLPRQKKVELYTVPDHNGNEIPVVNLPTSKLLYCETQQATKLAPGLSVLGDGYTLVQVAPRRLPKFLKHRPTAVPFDLAYKLHLSGLIQKVRQTSWEHHMMTSADLHFYCALDPNEIMDPEVKQAIQFAKQPGDPNAAAALKILNNALYQVGWDRHYKTGLEQLRVRRLTEVRYPLLKGVDLYRYSYDQLAADREKTSLLKHIYTYMNAVYLTIPAEQPTPKPEVAVVAVYDPAKHSLNGNGKIDGHIPVDSAGNLATDGVEMPKSKGTGMVRYRSRQWWKEVHERRVKELHESRVKVPDIPKELDYTDVPF